MIQFPGRVKSIDDIQGLDGPTLPEEATERGYTGVFETDEELKDTTVVWTRFPTPIVSIMHELAHDPGLPYGNKTVAVIRHAVYELLEAYFKEIQGDKAAEITQYLRSRNALADEAWDTLSGETQQKALYSIESFLSKAMDAQFPHDIDKRLTRLNKLYKASTNDTWRSEFKQRIKKSPTIRKAVAYLVREWRDGSPKEQHKAAGWESWMENIDS
jgi:hypothetical protein